MPTGPLAAALASVLLGLFPLCIKPVAQVPAAEFVVHRPVGSLVFAFAPLAVGRRLIWLALALYCGESLWRWRRAA